MRILYSILAAALLAAVVSPTLAQGTAGSTGSSSTGSSSANSSSASPGAAATTSAERATSVQMPSLQDARNTRERPAGLADPAGPPKPEGGARATAAPLETNDFQEFIFAGTGRRLPLFGQALFNAPPSTFAPVADAPVAPDYVVGPGDEIVLRAWGQIEVNLRLTVDRNGMLVIPKIGPVFVGGMRYQDMQGAIHAEMSKIYRNFEMAVTMGQLRGIQVFIVGLARQPGSYTIGSMSTLVNALFAAGGPSSRGSMRRIQLKRGNQVITEFDFYDMLLKGDTSRDVRLRQGDVIVVPPAGPLVAVSGSVNLPAVYELKEEKAPLREVLGWAGGLTTTASGRMVALERIEGRKSRQVAEMTLDDAGLGHLLRDGDLVTLFSISSKFENAVSVRGFVANTARHPWREGLRVRDLLPDAEAVTGPDYWKRRNDVSVTTARTLISPEEVAWHYAVIERIKADNSTDLIPFDLAAAVLKGDPQHNLLLRPGDVLTVFSKADMRVPRQDQRRYVRLEGEFAASGIYSVRPGETLRQMVARIGGFSPGAYVFGAEFTRESTRQLQQKQLDESIDRMEREAQRVAADVARNAGGEEAQGRTAQIAEQKALIARMRGIKASGRIVLGMNADSAGVKDLPDMPLEDGDRFYVPPTPSVVSVLGSVFNPNSFVYRESRRADDYLALAGGPLRTADEGSIYLLRADGTVSSKRQRGWLGLGSVGGEHVMPGDAIVVPEELERVTLTRELKEWSQIFYQFALGVAGLKVLRD